MTYEPKGNGPYDSRAAEAIDWYQHYMAVSLEGLALEYMVKVNAEGDSPSPMMEAAVEERCDEAVEELTGETPEGGD